MINTVRSFEAEADDRHSNKVQKDSMIGAAADPSVRERVVGYVPGLFPLSLFASGGLDPGLVKRFPGGIQQRAADFDQHGRQRGYCAGFEVRPRCSRIYVDVGDRFFAWFVGKLLTPFGRTRETHFFAIPTANHESTPRSNPTLEQLP